MSKFNFEWQFSVPYPSVIWNSAWQKPQSKRVKSGTLLLLQEPRFKSGYLSAELHEFSVADLTYVDSNYFMIKEFWFTFAYVDPKIYFFPHEFIQYILRKIVWLSLVLVF